ncbi:hypothetical protein [Mannheimia haemolytica]
MTEEDKEYLQSKIENEGFEYAFVSYSSFKEIQDEKFHELRKAYLKARSELAEYIDIED